MPAKTSLHRVFCENIRLRRLQLGLTQKEAGRLLGIKQGPYAKIEGGGSRIRIDGIESVAVALQTTPSKLLEPGAFRVVKKSLNRDLTRIAK